MSDEEIYRLRGRLNELRVESRVLLPALIERLCSELPDRDYDEFKATIMPAVRDAAEKLTPKQ